MPGAPAKKPDLTELTMIRVGKFSGSGIGLRDALAPRVQLADFDTLQLARDPRMALPRLAAVLEATLARTDGSWSKTAVWSRAVQRRLLREGLLKPGRQTLFVQSLLAPVLGPDHEYSVYTDRVGLEGSAAGGEFRSRYSRGWLDREARSLASARRVFVMGPSTKRVLNVEYGIAEERIHVVGAGVNCPLGPQITSNSCRRLLFVGIDWRRKGLPMLIDVFRDLRRDHPDLELTVVGANPDIEIPDGVTIAGKIPPSQMDPFYSNADAFVMPTNMEAYGIAITEALIKGIPCIGTTTGNQPWLIGDAGICVEPDSPAELHEAIESMIEHYSIYRAASSDRGARMRSTLSWDTVAQTILDQLRSDEPAPDITF